jgi:hypothetical protein
MTTSPAQQPRSGPPTEPRGEGDIEPRGGTGLTALLLVGLLCVLRGLAALSVALVTVVGTT